MGRWAIKKCLIRDCKIFSVKTCLYLLTQSSENCPVCFSVTFLLINLPVPAVILFKTKRRVLFVPFSEDSQPLRFFVTFNYKGSKGLALVKNRAVDSKSATLCKG